MHNVVKYIKIIKMHNFMYTIMVNVIKQYKVYYKDYMYNYCMYKLRYVNVCIYTV